MMDMLSDEFMRGQVKAERRVKKLEIHREAGIYCLDVELPQVRLAGSRRIYDFTINHMQMKQFFLRRPLRMSHDSYVRDFL